MTRRDTDGRVLIGSWAAATLLVPTLMRTKLPWYVDSFYPALALGIAAVLAHAWSQSGRRSATRRRYALGVVVVVALGVAESKLLWSRNQRDLRSSVQGLMLAEAHQLAGRRVFRERWDYADTFVLRALVRGDIQSCSGIDDCVTRSKAGDYLIASSSMRRAGLTLVRLHGASALYRRTDDAGSSSKATLTGAAYVSEDQIPLPV